MIFIANLILRTMAFEDFNNLTSILIFVKISTFFLLSPRYKIWFFKIYALNFLNMKNY